MQKHEINNFNLALVKLKFFLVQKILLLIKFMVFIFSVKLKKKLKDQ